MFIPERIIVNATQAPNHSLESLSILHPASFFVILLLVFYVMTLRDQWTNLNMRELTNRPIYCRSHPHYRFVRLVYTPRTARDNTYGVEQDGNVTSLTPASSRSAQAGLVIPS
ncbi:hypothetical protein AX15_002627 [Amanita polypyramis BW_CC]|nr:hypothetical protein AX15_002627 [Amanita polypyramis BW_CC]